MADTITFERLTRRLSIDADACTTLNDRARSTLRNALVLAIGEYENHAKEGRACADELPSAQRAGMQSFALQFDRQADDVRALLALIDGDDDAEADTAIIFVANGG